MSKVILDFDARSQVELDDLKRAFGVTTNAEVIRKALALAKVATANVDSSRSLTIVSGAAGEEVLKKISLAG